MRKDQKKAAAASLQSWPICDCTSRSEKPSFQWLFWSRVSLPHSQPKLNLVSIISPFIVWNIESEFQGDMTQRQKTKANDENWNII
jgi:hypothetical protein